MIKLAYDNYDIKRNHPYPNCWHKEICNYADTINERDYFNKVRNKFQLRTSHSEFGGNFIHGKNSYVLLKDINVDLYDSDVLYYPIEIFGNSSPLINEDVITNEDGIEYSFFILNSISKQSIELAKKNKLFYVWNISHEPFSDAKFIYDLTEVIGRVGLTPSNFIFFGGTSNLFDLHPDLKDSGYSFYFENNLLITSCKKIVELKERPNHKLGYTTNWFDASEMMSKRNKHFVCPNRNSNKQHRFTLGCYFESENLWDKVYCSFLQTSNNYFHIIHNLNTDFNKKMVNAAELFVHKLPIQMDTHILTESERECFESVRAFKKEIYTDSYIHIVTETGFENDIFITEKLINPMLVLQPFIIFAAPNYLKYVKELGFKTFDGFIDESYDAEIDTALRFEKLCKEIKRLSEFSLDEIHNWYISILPILEYNRNFAMEFSKKPMFINSLKNHNGI